MAEKQYTPEEIAQINKTITAQNEQVIKVRAEHEFKKKQLDELNAEIKAEFQVNSLGELREKARQEQSEINKIAANTVEIIASRKAILDHLAAQQSDKV